MAYWLMKSEPDVFSIDDLARVQIEPWDGVRNYQARNMLRDQMQLGDQVFFYHSNCDLPGIVGIAEVCRTAYPDLSALNPESKYFDPKATPENPRWVCVDVKFVRKLPKTISMQRLKTYDALNGWALIAKGNRLSVMPVSAPQWDAILAIAS